MVPAGNGKAASFLLLVLVVLAVVCLDSVNGKVVCTEQQKKDVLLHCKLNIVKPGNPAPPPERGPCCQLVRLLQGMDPEMMHCIVRLLTDEEKHHHSTDKILELKDRCPLPNPATKIAI
ncbi:hypothetical protein BS78_05G289800 [Paspalum vaginatum]|nr:hypothetical protein BS78_05G289800 [Paspalum vaginatum]